MTAVTSRYRRAERSARPLFKLFLALPLLSAVACADRAESNMALGGGGDADRSGKVAMESAVSDGAYAIAAPPAASPSPQSGADPMLIRTGSARLEVDSLEAALARVEALAGRLGGMVASSMLQTGVRQQRQASLSIRIPAVRFEEALSGLTPIGRLEALHVNTEDVGEEFVDISARLASARQLEQRLLEILRTRTGKLEDVLAVERELARVRAEIERYEGRIRYLQGRVEMSVLAVALHEPASVLATPPGETVLGRALRQSWRNFVALVAGAIAALGFLLPLGLAAGAVLYVVRRSRRVAPATPGAAGAV